MEQHLRKTWPPTEPSEDCMVGGQGEGLCAVIDGTQLSKWTAWFIPAEQYMMSEEVTRRHRGGCKQEQQHRGGWKVLRGT